MLLWLRVGLVIKTMSPPSVSPDLTLDDDNYGGDHWKTFKWSITDCNHSNDNNAEMTAASHNNIINFIIIFVAIDISMIILSLKLTSATITLN